MSEVIGVLISDDRQTDICDSRVVSATENWKDYLTSRLRCSLKVLEDDKELLCCKSKLGRLGSLESLWSFGESGSGDSSKYETELGTESSNEAIIKSKYLR